MRFAKNFVPSTLADAATKAENALDIAACLSMASRSSARRLLGREMEVIISGVVTQDDTASSQRSEVFMVTDLDGIPIDVSEKQNSAQSSQRSEDVKRWLQVKKENKAIRDHIQ